MAIQVLPLFLLPEIVLPWLGTQRALAGRAASTRSSPPPATATAASTGARTGLILAWPLNVYNVFTGHPLGWWLGSRSCRRSC